MRVLLSICALGMAVVHPMNAQVGRGSLVIEVTTELGDIIENPSAAVLDLGSRRVVAKFEQSRTRPIAYGEYTIQVRQPGFKWQERKVRISQSQAFAKIVLTLANLPAIRYFAEGRLKGLEAGDWIRLLPAFDPQEPVYEAQVAANGEFALGDVNGGHYILLVVRGLQIISTRVLTINSSVTPFGSDYTSVRELNWVDSLGQMTQLPAKRNEGMGG